MSTPKSMPCHLHRAHEILQDPQVPLDVLAHALVAVEFQQDRVQRCNDRYRQRLVVGNSDEIRQRALFLGHGLDFVQQDRLANAAQPHEHEAAGRPAGLVALDRETGVGENAVAPRLLQGRRSRAKRVRIYAWVHSIASTWFVRDRHKHHVFTRLADTASLHPVAINSLQAATIGLRVGIGGTPAAPSTRVPRTCRRPAANN